MDLFLGQTVLFSGSSPHTNIHQPETTPLNTTVFSFSFTLSFSLALWQVAITTEALSGESRCGGELSWSLTGWPRWGSGCQEVCFPPFPEAEELGRAQL